jgi:hypothetical protein
MAPEKLTIAKSMGMSFFGCALASLKAVGVSKRRTQTVTLVLRLIPATRDLQRPCTGPFWGGYSKKRHPHAQAYWFFHV